MRVAPDLWFFCDEYLSSVDGSSLDLLSSVKLADMYRYVSEACNDGTPSSVQDDPLQRVVKYSPGCLDILRRVLDGVDPGSVPVEELEVLCSAGYTFAVAVGDRSQIGYFLGFSRSLS